MNIDYEARLTYRVSGIWEQQPLLQEQLLQVPVKSSWNGKQSLCNLGFRPSRASVRKLSVQEGYMFLAASWPVHSSLAVGSPKHLIHV